MAQGYSVSLSSSGFGFLPVVSQPLAMEVAQGGEDPLRNSLIMVGNEERAESWLDSPKSSHLVNIILFNVG